MSEATQSKPSAAARAALIRRARARQWARRAILYVGIPTLIAIVYYGFLAADQYDSTAVFTVQSSEQDSGTDLGKLDDVVPDEVSSMIGGSAKKDGALAREIIRSRAMMSRLDADGGLRERWSKGDFVSRLASDAGTEDTFDYYREMVWVTSPSRAGTLTLRVRAFSPETAQGIATRILDETQKMLDEVVARTYDARIASARARGESQEYLAALATQRERARRYVVVISEPSLADQASHPKRLWGVATWFFVALALMGVLSLLGGAVREHAKF